MSGPRYAANTEVNPGRSREEIERNLSRYGAEQFAYATNPEGAMVAFVMNGRQVRFVLPFPDRTSRAFTLTETGRARTDKAAYDAWEQATRASWRALAAVIKAKLIAVEAGIVTFEEEFGMHMVLPNGSTVAETVLPAISRAYSTGDMPNLLAIER